MHEYRRRLPHIHTEGVAIFLNWRLHGSLAICHRELLLTSGRAFVDEDRTLGRCRQAPQWLSDIRIAPDESFDRLVRSGDELSRMKRYIEYNPVSAGFVGSVEDWHWSGAWKRAGESACLTP
jgi:hypothetical protein